jgi:hypothetical protein
MTGEHLSPKTLVRGTFFMGDQGTIKNLLNHDFENARIGFLRERILEAQRHWGEGRRKETEVSKWLKQLL